MMLKQSSSRNLRGKSVKTSRAFKIFVVLAICIWLLYQVKQSYEKKAVMGEERPEKESENEYQIMKIGRKHLKPRLDEEEAEVETKMNENENENERDEGDKEKSEEAEPDLLQDFIDEDDKDV